MNQRIDKENYYLDMAEAALNRGTCLRRNYGAIIVKDDSIVSTGYTGAPRGRKNCCDIGFCRREKENISWRLPCFIKEKIEVVPTTPITS